MIMATDPKPAEHKVLRFLLPASWFAALEASTRCWLLECPCGVKRDLWDAGGIRGKGSEKVTYTRCPACNHWKWHKKRRKTEAEKQSLA